jgi:dihydrofolate reductase
MACNKGKGVSMISFSVAIDPNKGIGIKGSLPWHIKDELKIFKANTMGKNIVMGQTTYDNLPNKLEGRYKTIISTNTNYHPEGVEVVNNLKEFIEKHQDDEKEYIICGGASIYRQTYKYAKKAYVSFIKKEYEVDTRFDEFNLSDWTITKEVEYEEFIYRELRRDI